MAHAFRAQLVMKYVKGHEFHSKHESMTKACAFITQLRDY